METSAKSALNVNDLFLEIGRVKLKSLPELKMRYVTAEVIS